ncbi:SUKH-4 family immunity protein [Kitasatospora sp. NPDC051170]
MLTYDDLIGWAGAGNLVRADAYAVAGWLVPDEQKALPAEVGVPAAPHW